MDISTEQLNLVKKIHEHVSQFPDNEMGNTQLLATDFDYMESFKRVMDSTTSYQMDYLINQYDGFYRFAKLLENMAQGIADGTIPVPKPH
jgi:hypothetical protein